MRFRAPPVSEPDFTTPPGFLRCRNVALPRDRTPAVRAVSAQTDRADELGILRGAPWSRHPASGRSAPGTVGRRHPLGHRARERAHLGRRRAAASPHRGFSFRLRADAARSGGSGTTPARPLAYAGRMPARRGARPVVAGRLPATHTAQQSRVRSRGPRADGCRTPRRRPSRIRRSAPSPPPSRGTAAMSTPTHRSSRSPARCTSPPARCAGSFIASAVNVPPGS